MQHVPILVLSIELKQFFMEGDILPLEWEYSGPRKSSEFCTGVHLLQKINYLVAS